MKLLVTGAHGQLAESLVERGAARGDDVIALGRPELDVTDPVSLTHALGHYRPDVVVNAAAYTAVDKAESEEDEAFRVNGAGAGHVARATAMAAIPLIHISTDYVFDGAKATPYVESDPCLPICAYGRSKLAGEEAVRAAAPRHIVLRTAWVHSPFGHNFTKTMLRLAASRPEIAVVDDQIGTPTYAPHLADAILRIATALPRSEAGPWGTYHAAGAGAVSWCGLAREIFAVARRRGGPFASVRAIPTSDYPTPARRPQNSRLDTAKLFSVFGIALPPWQQGVEEGVERLLDALATPHSDRG